MFDVFCDICKRLGKARFGFREPKGWIKHKTPDGLELLFCSVACFERFKGVKLMPRLLKEEPRVERPLVVKAKEMS